MLTKSARFVNKHGPGGNGSAQSFSKISSGLLISPHPFAYPRMIWMTGLMNSRRSWRSRNIRRRSPVLKVSLDE